jgi:glutamate dehydrogenase/leucine dehydrogenase
MSWMVDEYSQLRGVGETLKAAFTGKPVEFGGSQARREATGYGIALVMREAAYMFFDRIIVKTDEAEGLVLISNDLISIYRYECDFILLG